MVAGWCCPDTLSRRKMFKLCCITSTWCCLPSHRRTSKRRKCLCRPFNESLPSLPCGEDLWVAFTDSERLSGFKTCELRKLGWPSGLSLAALPAPVQPEPLAMPSDHGLWFDDEEGRAPTRPKTQ